VNDSLHQFFALVSQFGFHESFVLVAMEVVSVQVLATHPERKKIGNAVRCSRRISPHECSGCNVAAVCDGTLVA